MALERSPVAFGRIFLVYTIVGTLVASALVPVVGFTVVLVTNPRDLPNIYAVVNEISSTITTFGIIGIVPAAMAAAALCIAMMAISAVNSRRGIRSAMAAICAALAILVFIRLLVGPLHSFPEFIAGVGQFAVAGVLTAAVLAYLYPATSQVPSNPSLERP